MASCLVEGLGLGLGYGLETRDLESNQQAEKV